MADAQRLLSIQEGGAQRAWLQANAPLPNADLVAQLSDAVSNRGYSDPNESLRIANILKIAADAWQDDLTNAAANHAVGAAYSFLGDYSSAIEHLSQASTGLRILGEDVRAAHAELRYVLCLMYVGAYSEAFEVGRQAQAVLEQTDDRIANGRLQMNLGNLAYRMGDLKEADEYFKVARSLIEEARDPSLLAVLDVNHANIQIEVDEFGLAQESLQSARKVFAEDDAAHYVARVDANIAYLLFAQGEFEQALNRFEAARPVTESVSDVFTLVTIDLHRSEIYLALNLWQEALQTVAPARALLLDASQLPWEAGRLWLNEAVALARMGEDYQNALQNARTVFAQESNQYWIAIADLYEATFAYHRDDYLTARSKAQAALASFNAVGAATRVAKCEILLGNIALQQMKVGAAISHFEKADGVLTDAQLPVFTYAIYYGLGRCALLSNDLQAALQQLRRAVDDLEKLQGAITAEDFKIGYLSDKVQVYEALVQTCLQINTPASLDEAFATVERAKSRALLDVLARNEIEEAVVEDVATRDLLEQIQALQRDLSWYYNKLNNPPDGSERSSRYLASLNVAVNERERQLQQHLRRLRSPNNDFESIEPITAAHLQTILPSGLTLIEYYTVGDQIHVFVVKPDKVCHEILPIPLDAVNVLLGQLRFQMNKFGYGARYRRRHASALKRSCDDVLQQLYEGLIAPLLSLVTDSEIVVVPHNLLHYVPFHALFDGESYVVDKHVVSYAPSSTLLSRTLQAKAAVSNNVPKIVGIDDATIPFAQDEARAIASLFPETELLVGEDATLGNVLQDNGMPAFLHLSTHALFRNDNASFSSLKLQDGWLSVHDIYSMNCIPELVTLSACETGRHQVLRGDELIGLCRGFFAKGAKSLVVSLWKVEDQSAADLMTYFYRELRAGLEVNKALREAQLMVKREKAHPYYWAPFVLTGNMETQINLN